MTIALSLAEFYALACAFLWAFNGMLLRTQSHRVSPAAMNVIRCGVAGLFYWIMLPFDAPLSGLAQVTLKEWGMLLGNLTIGLVVGDTIYLAAIREIGISRTMAMSSVFPLTTLFFDWLLMGQPVGWNLVGGSAMVVLGAALLSVQTAPSNRSEQPMRLQYGILLALCAAFLWGLSTVMLRPAIAHMTLIQANAIRMPMVALLLFLTRVLPSSKERLRGIEGRPLLIVSASGLLGMGIGALFFLAALRQIGAAKTVTLTSVMPVFGVVLGALFLKEQVDRRLLLGTGFCMAGVWLVI